MSMRVVPERGHPEKHRVDNGAPSAEIVHDTMRHGMLSVSNDINSRHPLEPRLSNWQGTQDELKMEGLRRMFGAHEPIRRQMERETVRNHDFRPAVLGGPSNLHHDILTGRDMSFDLEDIVKHNAVDGVQDFHTELERRML